MQKKQLLPVLLLLLSTLALWGQNPDPVFSQFYAAPLQLNPAFAGTTYAPRIAINYRNQYPSLPNAYATYAVSYEQFVSELNSGFGMRAEVDEAGDGLVQTSNFSAIYGYRVHLGSGLYMKFGLEAGYSAVNYDWDRLVFLDQIDPVTGPTGPDGTPNATNELRPEDVNTGYFDAGAGFLAYNSKFYAGVTLRHLTTPNESIINSNGNLATGRPMSLGIHGGTQIMLNSGNNRKMPTFISPNLLFLHQGGQGQVNGGAYFGVGPVFAGLWYRHAFNNPDAIIVLAGWQTGIFKIGYSVDIGLSALNFERTGGAHEISIVLNFENSEAAKARRNAERYNDCFRLFR